MVLFSRILKLIQLSETILDKLDKIAAAQTKQTQTLNRLEKKMPSEKDLDDALERQAVAIQNAADRVSAQLDALNQKIADLTAAQGQPIDLSDEIASIQGEIQKLAEIAPDDVSPPPPPDGGSTPNVPDEGPIEST